MVKLTVRDAALRRPGGWTVEAAQTNLATLEFKGNRIRVAHNPRTNYFHGKVTDPSGDSPLETSRGTRGWKSAGDALAVAESFAERQWGWRPPENPDHTEIFYQGEQNPTQRWGRRPIPQTV